MKIEILKGGVAIAEKCAEDNLYLVYEKEYEEGDQIRVTTDEKGFYRIQLDATLAPAVVYSEGGAYTLSVPFGQKHDCYNSFAFKGEMHYLAIRKAYECEIGYRNLAFNPYDSHENDAFYPHTKANIETRGESVFASRNAIDGIVASNNHGFWPFISWGINRDPKAELHLDFKRDVVIDKIIFYTRADFPHDAWWDEASITFSDGDTIDFSLKKFDGPQVFSIKEKKISSLTLHDLIKADDPSPFPALVQLEVYGKEA